jgi:hypothetical protein
VRADHLPIDRPSSSEKKTERKRDSAGKKTGQRESFLIGPVAA